MQPGVPKERVSIGLWAVVVIASTIFWLPMMLTLLTGGITGRIVRESSVRRGLLVGFWLGIPASAAFFTALLASYPAWSWAGQPDPWGAIALMLLFAVATAVVVARRAVWRTLTGNRTDTHSRTDRT